VGNSSHFLGYFAKRCGAEDRGPSRAKSEAAARRAAVPLSVSVIKPIEVHQFDAFISRIGAHTPVKSPSTPVASPCERAETVPLTIPIEDLPRLADLGHAVDIVGYY
jgi:hypothetical protein